MDEQTQKDIVAAFVTMNELLAKHLPSLDSENLALVPVKKPQKRELRRIFLMTLALWITIVLVGSIALFFLTRSNFSFVPLTVTLGFISSFIGIIVKFLFWRSEDYRQEELRQALRVKKLEIKHKLVL